LARGFCLKKKKTKKPLMSQTGHPTQGVREKKKEKKIGGRKIREKNPMACQGGPNGPPRADPRKMLGNCKKDLRKKTNQTPERRQASTPAQTQWLWRGKNASSPLEKLQTHEKKRERGKGYHSKKKQSTRLKKKKKKSQLRDGEPAGEPK